LTLSSESVTLLKARAVVSGFVVNALKRLGEINQEHRATVAPAEK